MSRYFAKQTEPAFVRKFLAIIDSFRREFVGTKDRRGPRVSKETNDTLYAVKGLMEFLTSFSLESKHERMLFRRKEMIEYTENWCVNREVG